MFNNDDDNKETFTAQATPGAPSLGMDVPTAMDNITKILRAFNGNADVHEALALSLLVVRARLEQCDAYEKDRH